MIDGIGIGLSKRFYESLVLPTLKQHFPNLPHAAARIGLGSEVLGYDTNMSADHDYGPCVQIFLSDAGFFEKAQEIKAILDLSLPDTFEDWKVRYPTNIRPSAADFRSGMLGSEHGVELCTLSAWCDCFLGRQFAADLTTRDWLSYPEQFFLTVTAGAVFRDDTGELSALRNRLCYFPRDVWLYKLVAQWGRIAIGRTGDVGDELGSRIIAARMVGNIMRLAMLVERRYAPYPKWFGTAFSRLPCAPELTEILNQILSAPNWQKREAKVFDACWFIAELQIARGVPGAIAPSVGSLHNRPFRFVDSLKIGNALRSAIADEKLRELPEFGAADQFVSSNFVLAVPKFSSATVIALLDRNLK